MNDSESPFTPEEKQPLGIMPRDVWIDRCRADRLNSILDAIARFKNARRPIPQAWLDELAEL